MIIMDGKIMMYVTDKDHKMLYLNGNFRDCYPNIKIGQYCYKELGNFDDVCPHCPLLKSEKENIFYNKASGEWIKSQVTELEWEGNPDCYVVFCKAWRRNPSDDIPDFLDNDKITDLKLRNKLLLQKNQLLRYINDELPAGFHQCAVAEGFPLIHISNQMLRILGLTVEEIKTKFDNKFANLVHPDDRIQLENIFETRFNEVDRIAEFKYRMYSKNGYIWVKDVTKLCEYDGEMFYQGTIFNINAEIENQLEIQQRNRDMEIILSSIPGGMKISKLDENFSYKFVSAEASALLGYDSVDEFMKACQGSAKNIVYTPDCEKAKINGLKSVHNGTYSVKYRVYCKDGSLKYILECGKKFTDSEGDDCVNSLYLDVTKEEENENLIRLQQNLIESEAEQKKQQEKNLRQYEIIQALSRDYGSVYYVDLEKDTFEVYRLQTYLSDKVRSAMKESENTYSKSILTYIEDSVYETDRDLMRNNLLIENIRSKLTDKEFFQYNYRVSRDDSIIYFQVKCVRSEKDGLSKVILGFSNVDDEVRSEIEQKQLLSEALSQAEYANRAKTIFLNNMSHDIRTPMNAIIGFTSLALTYIDNKERVANYLGKISQSSNHLLSLINDVLDMSRIESGKMRLEEKSENLAEIMQNMRNIIQSDIHSKHLKLDIDTIDVTDEDIYCDKLRLNQILLNIISNSIKFTKPGGMISIRIKQLLCLTKKYATYEFRVRDNGIGMSKEFSEHIFEPFTRESSSTVSGIQGTGLGMSITKNIVDMMNGSIEVHSEQGRGTEFIVTLRFKLQSEHKKIEVIKELEGLRSLVVDDDMNTCQSVSKMLRQLGLRAEWTMYGKEAIARTKEAVEMEDSYKCYIIDWQMPDMNGIETARQIRKIVGEDASIIMLSAYDWTDIEDEAKLSGVTGFVSKPLFILELQRILKNFYKNKERQTIKDEFPIENLKNKKILLVEDNELNREIATEILNMTGVEVETAENGKIAVDMFANSKENYYDLILMDIQMPVMNGYDATRNIRELDRPDATKIPIFAMTANAFAEDIEASKNAGMNEHLAKPLAPERLMSILKKWL